MMADGELFVRADSPLIQFSGRSIIDASGARSFDFPGALISARIVGYGSITAILNESGTNRYAASLDGGKSWLPDTINTISGRHEYTIPLEPTRLRGDFQLLKLTEACSAVFGCSWADYGVATLLGLRLGGGARLQEPACAPRPRRLEFIGDSITAGWASTTRDPPAGENETICNLGEDIRSSWAHLTAQLLDAEAPHVIAWGGIGLVQNDDAGTRPEGAASPAVWRRALANDPKSLWDHSSWVPHATLIHLGTNDLCCSDPVRTDPFESAYVDFIKEIVAVRGGGGGIRRRRNLAAEMRAGLKAAVSSIGRSRIAPRGPPASSTHDEDGQPHTFLLACGPMGNSKNGCDHTGRCDYFPCATIERIARAVNATGGARAHVLNFTGLMDDDAGVGGCRHPSERAHERMARIAASKLREVFGWN